MDLISLFDDYTFLIVAMGSIMLGFISGVIGSFVVLRKQSLLGDGISHAALPGVVLSFLIIGSKNTEILLLGAFITGLIATFIINIIVSNTRIKFDSALSLILSVFFGGGIVLLTYCQKIPNANQAGLDRFIYGQTASMLERDLWLIFICTTVLLLFVILFFKEFKILCFDPIFAKTIGYKKGILSTFLSLLFVITIVIGLQTVGVILMSAMLIAPAVSARQWSNKLSVMVFLAGIIGGFSGLAGTIISSSYTRVPTGPSIVLCVSSITLFSITFAPNRGFLYKIYQRKINKIKFNNLRKVK